MVNHKLFSVLKKFDCGAANTVLVHSIVKKTIKYSIVSYTKGGVEIEGSPALNELYVNTKTGLVTILNSNTEITSV